MTLAQRLFLLVVVALLPALAIQAYNELDLQRSREAEVRELALRQAELAASELTQILEGVHSLLTAVAEVPAVRALDAGPCAAFLATLQPRVSHVRSIAALDLAGRVACRNSPAPPGLRLADRPYFQEVLRSGGFVVGDYTIASVLQQPVLPMALPVRDDAGVIVGAVVATLDLRWLGEQLARRALPPGGSVTIADRHGTILAREPLPERFVGTAIPQPFLRLVTAPGPGTEEVVSQDGTRRILGYVPSVPLRRPYVSAGLSSDTAFAAVDRAMGRGFAWIAAGFALALLLAYLAGRHFLARPVDQLLAAAARWRGGDYDARTGLAGWRGEFGALGAAFDAMAQEIGRRQAEQEETTAALRESEARFRLIARASSEVVWEWDLVRDRVFWGDNLTAVIGHPPERIAPTKGDDMRASWERWDELIHPDDRGRAQLGLDRAVEQRAEFWADEYRFLRADGYVWLSERDCLVYDEAGRLVRMVGALRDVTQRRAAEERQRLLLHELSHRVKNTLTVVRVVAARSLSGDRGLDEACQVFTRRLAALATAHDLLTQSEWRGAGLWPLAAAELAPYGVRAELVGPDLTLNPKAALSLGLVLHELATNAAKHGALSLPEGRLELSWQLDGLAGAEPALHLRWRECHGPPVTVPSRRGFGRTLIEQGLQHDLDGTVTMDFAPDGLVCTMSIPARSALAGKGDEPADGRPPA